MSFYRVCNSWRNFRNRGINESVAVGETSFLESGTDNIKSDSVDLGLAVLECLKWESAGWGSVILRCVNWESPCWEYLYF